MHKIKFQYFQSAANNQFYFRIVARNGEKLAQSEGYVEKRNMNKAVRVIVRSINPKLKWADYKPTLVPAP